MSPRIEHALEMFSFYMEMAKFDPSKHLREREKQYCESGRFGPGGCFLIRETEEGWWKESHDANNDKQLKKLIDHPTVAALWMNTPRFTDNGGWDDPNG